MPRAAPVRSGMDLADHNTQVRLGHIGCPTALANILSALDVSVALVERVHRTGLPWEFVRSLCASRSLRTSEDVAALVTFTNAGLDAEEIRQWAAVGALDAALRLHLKNVPLAVVQGFPLSAEHGLPAFVRMLQTIQHTGIHVEDVLLWHTAGVLSLIPPYLHEAVWARWRAAAVVERLGMRPAAVAAAAGLSVDEALRLRAEGEFDLTALQMMAALRAGNR